jgi:hypothetical protein
MTDRKYKVTVINIKTQEVLREKIFDSEIKAAIFATLCEEGQTMVPVTCEIEEI